MAFGDIAGVAPEHARLDARRTDHVIGHKQDVLALHPVVVPGNCRRQFINGARLGVALKQQVQHRHEVRFTAAEAAVQVGTLVAVLLTGDGALDEAQCIVEAPGQLGGDHVILQGLIDGIGFQPAGEVQYEVAALDLFGDGDEFFY